MTLTVRTLETDGTSPYRLEEFGQVSNLQKSDGWPFGCLSCSFDYAVPVDFSHPSLRPGRILDVYEGCHRVWRGVLQDPLRGSPWHIQANGLASLADEYVPVNGAGTTLTPSVAVSAAITRGLPWVDLGTLPAAAGAATGQTPATVTQVLNDATANAGSRWAVNEHGQVYAAADPTTVSYLVIAGSTPGSRSIDNYVTNVYVLYYDSGTSPARVKVTSAGSASRPFGRYERLLDITSQGPVSAGYASSYATIQLSGAGDLTYSGAVTVQQGGIVTPGGVDVALSTVKAGLLVEARGTSQDPEYGALNSTTRVRWVIGEAAYDSTAQTLTLTPVGARPKDLSRLLQSLATNEARNIKSLSYA